MGIGFPPEKNKKGKILQESLISSHPEMIPYTPTHKILMGNHDSRKLFSNHPNYLGDYGYHEKSGIFYISGAFSIDFDMRTIGIDWWEWEELSWKELQTVIEMYGDVKPRMVASHDVPSIAAHTMFPETSKRHWHSRTQEAMDRCYEIYAPEIWIHGHYHVTKKTLGTTRFQCVGMQQVLELPGLTWESNDREPLPGWKP